jgi:hypothetical protein
MFTHAFLRVRARIGKLESDVIKTNFEQIIRQIARAQLKRLELSHVKKFVKELKLNVNSDLRQREKSYLH